jgi:hypothetical protein
MMMGEFAVYKTEEYIRAYLFEPKSNWNNFFFKERSYSIWAANEILERLKKQEGRPYGAIIDEFIEYLNDFMYVSKSCVTDDIGVAAIETAVNVKKYILEGENLCLKAL